MMQRRHKAGTKRKFDKTAERVKAFTPPDWAGKAPPGLHLDVHKNEKLIEKQMIDEKPFYLFGRNADIVDIAVEHASCSRYHAALVYHKILKRSFIIDLKSTHGSFIGSIRLDPHTPHQLQLDQTIHFGASSRTYTLRERPQGTQALYTIEGEKKQLQELLGIENERELDDLTEFNTAHNKRVAVVPGGDKDAPQRRKSGENHRISFNLTEETINPEDIDPSIGRFRNMISTSIVLPNKDIIPNGEENMTKNNQITPNKLYSNVPEVTSPTTPSKPKSISSYLPVVNAAPEPLDLTTDVKVTVPEIIAKPDAEDMEPKRKKYAKESWPGRKAAAPTIAPLLF